MNRGFNPRLLCMFLSLTVGAGCATTGLSPRNYSVRTVAVSGDASAFDAAEHALLDVGLTIALRDPASGSITTRPFAATGSLGDGTVYAPPGPEVRRRRVAFVRLHAADGEGRVFCRVDLQDRATQTFRILALERTRGDVPSATPIEREAATTSEQNTVWQTIRRDKSAERVILEAILNRVGKAGNG